MTNNNDTNAFAEFAYPSDRQAQAMARTLARQGWSVSLVAGVERSGRIVYVFDATR